MTIGSLKRLLTVTPAARVLGFEAFTSSDLWTPAGRTLAFGGQVVAQSLMAASHTVEDKEVHSQHSYFLLPASSDKPITYTVERLRDGKSYSTRLVHAIQDSRTIFILMASFSSAPRPLDPVEEEEPPMPAIVSKIYPPRPFAPEYRAPFPEDITPYDQSPTEQGHWKAYLQETKDAGVDVGSQKAPIQSYIDERSASPVGISIARKQTGKWGSSRAVWLKPHLSDGAKLDNNTVRCLSAFMTDFQMLLTAGRTVGLSATSHPPLGMVASLDHSMHFYPLPPNFDPAAPLLHVIETDAVDVEAGRGLTRGLLFTEDGHLVATTSQEGAVRAARAGKGPSGVPVSM